MNNNYQICNRCIMDSTIKDIFFNKKGNCNYCEDFLTELKIRSQFDFAFKKEKKENFISKVKKDGKNKKYDCIVGVSGGLDSSFALIKAVNNGLRPLAVHMDNGWNSELAQNNIENLVRSLKVDLFTYVVDWDEYRNLMQSFFDANVIDVELLYDNAMMAINYQQASKYKVKYILSGSNLATEGMRMPKQMNWFKFDKRNIKSIAKKFGKIKIKTFPSIGTLDYLWFEFCKRIRWVPFLDYFDYNKSQTLEILIKNYNFKPYPYKHYESIFTRFYQGFILPKKFNVDKRILHLSTLIISNQMKREQALKNIKLSPYQSDKQLKEDKFFFLKKMNWTEEELKNYINKTEKSHSLYKSEKSFYYFLVTIYKMIFGKKKKRNFI